MRWTRRRKNEVSNPKTQRPVRQAVSGQLMGGLLPPCGHFPVCSWSSCPDTPGRSFRSKALLLNTTHICLLKDGASSPQADTGPFPVSAQCLGQREHVTSTFWRMETTALSACAFLGSLTWLSQQGCSRSETMLRPNEMMSFLLTTIFCWKGFTTYTVSVKVGYKGHMRLSSVLGQTRYLSTLGFRY